MTDVLRSTTFQLEFKWQDGIAGIRQFTRAVSDVDETVDELSKTLGDNTEVTVKNIKSKEELTADGRRLVSQMERTKTKMRELTRFYESQSKAVNRTADEQEVLNAVYKLGAHATEKQKNEVSKLVQSYQEIRKSTDKTQTGFRNLRGVSQNLGWQLQDVAVQAQMGTSAFIIFSQQGSQMASSFGPGGALIGAFIAVAGAMAGVAASTDKAKESAKALKDAKLDLIPVLQDQAKALKFLEAAQLRVLKTQDAKILKELGIISEYRWANRINDVVNTVLTLGPMVVGTKWFTGMNRPNSKGIVRPTGGQIGGHAYLINGVDKTNKYLRIKNSWGKRWGKSGYAFISFRDFEKLLHDGGEACIAFESKLTAVPKLSSLKPVNKERIMTLKVKLNTKEESGSNAFGSIAVKGYIK